MLDKRSTYTFVFDDYTHSTVDRLDEQSAEQIANENKDIISWNKGRFSGQYD